MDITVVVVSYNTRELLEKCLTSLDEYGGGARVVVVDNASEDGSAAMVRERFPHVKLYEEPENVGFSAANNVALSEVETPLVLILNPDTQLMPGTLERCVAHLYEKNAGILGCRVLLSDGSLDIACRRGFPTLTNSFFKLSGLSRIFPRSKFFCGYNLTYLDEKGSYEVDSVVGAFMLIQKKVLEDIGLFDERFFMYGEDLDLCRRAKNSGYKVCYYGGADILHHKRASSKRSKRAHYEFYNAMKIFYEKYHAENRPALVNFIVYGAIDLLCRGKGRQTND